MDMVWWCQISEYQIIEISENVCNLKKQEADWILKIDIVEQGDRLGVRILQVSFLCLYNGLVDPCNFFLVNWVGLFTVAAQDF